MWQTTAASCVRLVSRNVEADHASIQPSNTIDIPHRLGDPSYYGRVESSTTHISCPVKECMEAFRAYEAVLDQGSLGNTTHHQLQSRVHFFKWTHLLSEHIQLAGSTATSAPILIRDG